MVEKCCKFGKYEFGLVLIYDFGESFRETELMS